MSAAGASGRAAPFSTLSLEDDIEANLDLNVRSAVSLTRVFVPQMIKRKRGRVLLVSSVTSMTPSPKLAMYAASKAFLNSFALVKYLFYYEMHILSFYP